MPRKLFEIDPESYATHRLPHVPFTGVHGYIQVQFGTIKTNYFALSEDEVTAVEILGGGEYITPRNGHHSFRVIHSANGSSAPASPEVAGFAGATAIRLLADHDEPFYLDRSYHIIIGNPDI